LVRYYRNPMYLAREYQEMIAGGKTRNQADLARQLDIYRARVDQVLQLLEWPAHVQRKIERFGNQMTNRLASKRKYRS